MRENHVEILAPAGSAESAEAAVCAGADAIYTGGVKFGARAYADNPEEEEMLRLIDYAHLHGRKIYMTVNTLLKQEELEELYGYLLPYYRQGLDAVIVQDTGVMQYIRKNFSGLPLHISTQAAVTNALGAEFYGRAGAERIVPARELSLVEIRDMKEKTGLEIECFVHGAMCYCYSGQCLLSSMIGGRSGNRGQCAQPCRLPYSVDGGRPQDILSLKDLCTIDLLPELLKTGIDSLKIEGRMKQPEYVYTVTSMYRKYADLYYERGEAAYKVSEADRQALMGAYQRRGYSDGYYKRQNGKEMISFCRPKRKIEGNAEKNDRKEYKIKEKINGNLILSEGKRAKLGMEYHGKGKACYVEVFGDTVQRAVSAPLGRERIERQMRKTGDTQFEIGCLEIETEGNVFLPMQSLNVLRREGLRILSEQIVSRYRRGQSQEPKDLAQPDCQDGKEAEGGKKHRRKLQVCVQTKEQLHEACRMARQGEQNIDTVYVDGRLAFDKSAAEAVSVLRSNQTEVFAAMPYIFRERAIAAYEAVWERLSPAYDGVLIRNWESYEWLRKKKYEKPIVSDYNLYVFNRESRDFMIQAGIRDYTFSPELNFRELKAFGGGGILPVYGRQPVMITAGCIQKTEGGCRKEEKVTWLTDRCKKMFPVKNDCTCCYNVMYNCAPLVLAGERREVDALSLSCIRLDFTTEGKEEMRRILALYEKEFLRKEEAGMPDIEYTRGHFRRGVK